MVSKKGKAISPPTIYITHFETQIKKQVNLKSFFIRLIKYSDWFKIADKKESAQLLVAVKVLSEKSMEIRIKGNLGKDICAFRQSRTQDNLNILFRMSVDTLIKKLFGVPGLMNSKIAFVSDITGHKEIYTAYPDVLSSCKKLTSNGSFSLEPNWSTTENALVYTVYEKNGASTDIIYADILHSRNKRLCGHPGTNAGGALSPSGKNLALTMSKDGSVDLYVISVKGSGSMRLTKNQSVEVSPCWSPDGQSICYVSDHSGHPSLYLKSLKNDKTTHLTRGFSECVSPDWSPISNKLCFSIKTGRNYSIAIMDMNEKGNYRIITSAAGDWESPSWAPDGRHIVCSRSLNKKSSLYMINTVSGRIISLNPKEINLGNCSFSNWSALF
ncbi:MAG: hypothetical protein U9O87_08995 [Verrucomicrobiota bacterium]|nr:hypothetical protein [Verrucomicrobiota bacterium]